jgi:hypothetical protein
VDITQIAYSMRGYKASVASDDGVVSQAFHGGLLAETAGMSAILLGNVKAAIIFGRT